MPDLKDGSVVTVTPVPSTTSWDWGGGSLDACYLESVSDGSNNLGHNEKVFLS